MSWGSTSYTPMITYNNPPFGFHEHPQPPDFPTCPENPYSGAKNIKEDIRQIFDSKLETFGNPIGPDNTIDFPKLILWIITFWFVWNYLLRQ